MKTRQAGKGLSLVKTGFYLTLVLCPLLFTSCRHTPEKNATENASTPVVQPPHKVTLIALLLGGEEKTFRNVSFGDNPETVRHSEKKAADEVDTNYLSYTLPLDTINADSVNEQIDSLNYFTIAYNFDQQKLNEVDEDVYLSTDSVAAELAQRFSNYFTDKYGQPAAGSDETVWSFTSKGKKIKVTLSDQSAEYDYGKLSLVFYCEDY